MGYTDSLTRSPAHPLTCSHGGAVAILVLGLALLPLPSIAPILGLGLALVLSLLDPVFGLYCAVLSVPMQDLVQLPGGVTCTQAAMLLATSAWGLRVLAHPERPIAKGRLLPLWAALLWVLLLATSFTPYSRAEGFKEVFRWGESFLIWLIAVNTIERPWQIAGLAACLLLAPAADAAIGLVQAATGDGPSSFRIAPGSLLVRAYGTIGAPNSFAGYLNMAWPLALALAVGATWRAFRPPTTDHRPPANDHQLDPFTRSPVHPFTQQSILHPPFSILHSPNPRRSSFVVRRLGHGRRSVADHGAVSSGVGRVVLARRVAGRSRWAAGDGAGAWAAGCALGGRSALRRGAGAGAGRGRAAAGGSGNAPDEHHDEPGLVRRQQRPSHRAELRGRRAHGPDSGRLAHVPGPSAEWGRAGELYAGILRFRRRLVVCFARPRPQLLPEHGRGSRHRRCAGLPGAARRRVLPGTSRFAPRERYLPA